MQEVSALTGIDQGLLSKYESGKRIPTEHHLLKMASALSADFSQLQRIFLIEKIAYLLADQENYQEILMAAEPRIDYLRSQQVFEVPVLTPDQARQLERIDYLKEKWQRDKPFDGTQLQKMQQYFHILYTYDSNRIEGNTLTLQETQLIVNEGLTISGKSVREHLEAINHAEAVDFLTDLVKGKEDLNKRNLLDLHRLVLKSIDTANAGRYRNVPVRISGSEHVPPEPYMLDKMMEDYFLHYDLQKHKMHPVILAAEMHERLVSIHPFIDGNGRTSRLVMNFVLLRHGYTVTNLKGDIASRLAYYQSLDKVQTSNDPAYFYDLILGRVIDSLERHLEML